MSVAQFYKNPKSTEPRTIPSEMVVVLPMFAAERTGHFFGPSVRAVDLMYNGDANHEDVRKQMRLLAQRIINNHPEFGKSLTYTDNYVYNGCKSFYTADKAVGGLVSMHMHEVVFEMMVHEIYRVNVTVFWESVGYVPR